MNPMVNIYVNLIKYGLKKIEDVPMNLRMAVESALSNA